MKMIKVVSLLFVLGMIFPQILDQDYIVFQTDAIGHNNIYLNKVNPYKQSTFECWVYRVKIFNKQCSYVPYATRFEFYW